MCAYTIHTPVSPLCIRTCQASCILQIHRTFLCRLPFFLFLFSLALFCGLCLIKSSVTQTDLAPYMPLCTYGNVIRLTRDIPFGENCLCSKDGLLKLNPDLWSITMCIQRNDSLHCSSQMNVELSTKFGCLVI